MLSQFPVAAENQSPTWPVDLPGESWTHCQGFVERVEAVRCRHRGRAEPKACVRTRPGGGVPPGTRPLVLRVPRLAARDEVLELLAVRDRRITSEGLVSLRVVEAEGRQPACLERRTRSDRREDLNRGGGGARRPARRDVVERRAWKAVDAEWRLRRPHELDGAGVVRRGDEGLMGRLAVRILARVAVLVGALVRGPVRIGVSRILVLPRDSHCDGVRALGCLQSAAGCRPDARRVS